MSTNTAVEVSEEELEDGNSGTSSVVERSSTTQQASPLSSQNKQNNAPDRRVSLETPNPSLDTANLSEDQLSDDKSKEKGRKISVKDRSKLRKGKWTVEEEEYTSKIIHYFRAGLLKLPDGATLRSFLAEKLNCDPMRITKKYAGASCLGRRVHHFRDRPQPTIGDIMLAKTELDHSEQRFRMRVEQGHSTALPSHASMMMPAALSQNQNTMMPPNILSTANALQTWLVGLAAASSVVNNTAALSQPPQPATTTSGVMPTWAIPPNVPAPQAAPVAAPLLLPNKMQAPPPIATNAIGIQPPKQGLSQQDINAAILSLALSQASALSRASSTQTPSVAPSAPQAPPVVPQVVQKQPVINSTLSQGLNDLRATYEQHLKAQGISIPVRQDSSASQKSKDPAPLKAPVSLKSKSLENGSSGSESCKKLPSKPPPTEQIKNSSAVADDGKPRTEEDKADGNILMGFLSSLRCSYEDALKEKKRKEREETTSSLRHSYEEALKENQRKVSVQRNADNNDANESSFEPTPATVTDSGNSDQRESSVEDYDWKSEKKSDQSSSEESDKEVNDEKSRGPPRKRLKSLKLKGGTKNSGEKVGHE